MCVCVCVGGGGGVRGHEGRFGLCFLFVLLLTGKRKLVAVVRPLVYMFYIQFTVK